MSEDKKPAKTVQIAFSIGDDPLYEIYALRDDGSIWGGFIISKINEDETQACRWRKLQPIPQPGEESPDAT